MKRILFNATHAEELRVAIVDGQTLLDLDLESAIRVQRKGNIYKGTVTRVEPSLEACFINYGQDRHGFLPFKEIYRGYFKNYSSDTAMSKLNIKDVIKEGQELIVQVEKDERGNKGAALTTFISLAGRFLVLMPNNPKGGGISRRVEGQQRSDLKRALDSLKMPKQHAMIARTAALGRTEAELKWDYDFLIGLWNAIEDASANSKAPTLIYKESNLLVRAIRDHLNKGVQELIVDDKEMYERATRFVKQVMPQNLSKIKLHEDTTPLFSRFQIEHQIEAAFSREVRLPSGGAIVIDHTEALISIDVNSARATKGSDIEDTAVNTNLEAVDEIGRQLRIRDLGGLIVLDLIDMSANQNQRKVEARLKSALSHDRARVQVGRISRFGLLEMSRQRIRASLGDSNYHTCPRCEGTGHIRSIVSGSLSLLRIIEEEALKENTESLHVFLPTTTAAYILNEKRRELSQLEARLATNIVVIPDADLQSPHYEVTRLRSNEIDNAPHKASHQLKRDTSDDDKFKDITGRKPKAEKALIDLDQMTHASPPPPAAASAVASVAGEAAAKAVVKPANRDPSLIKRIWMSIKGEPANDVDGAKKDQELEDKPEEQAPKRNNNRRGGNNRRSNAQGGANSRNNNNNNNRRRSRGPGSRRRNNNQNPNQNQNQNPNQGNSQGGGQANNQGDKRQATPQNQNSQNNKPNNANSGRAPSDKTSSQAGNTRANDQANNQGNSQGNSQSNNQDNAKPQAESKPRRGRPRKQVESGSENAKVNTSEISSANSQVKSSDAVQEKKPRAPRKAPQVAKASEADGNATGNTKASASEKKAPVRKKRVSKKRTAAKKPVTREGNANKAEAAKSTEVDGNK